MEETKKQYGRKDEPLTPESAARIANEMESITKGEFPCIFVSGLIK